MKKSLLWIVVLVLSISMVAAFSFAGCKKEAAPVEEAVEEVVAEEEEVVAEEAAPNPKEMYTYEKLREMSEARAYDGTPAAGHKFAFCNLLLTIPICQDVQDGIIEEWALAGGNADDLLILDNNVDVQTSLDNAEIVFNSGSEVFIQFQADAQVNAMIAKRATDAGVFMIGIDIPVSGFPFMGANNYNISQMTGEWTAEHIDSIYGGWDNVDVVFICWHPASGADVTLRTKGAADVLAAKYGDTAKLDGEGSKVVSVQATGTAESGQEAILDALAAHPDAENIVVFNLNTPESSGIIEGAKLANRWDPDKWTVITQGYDDVGKELLDAGETDLDVNYHFDQYARYCVPGGLAYVYGNVVPSHMFVTMELVEGPQYK